MQTETKQKRYDRIFQQTEKLIKPVPVGIPRMATIAALLHHKMNHFFWTGFYILQDGGLYVGPYQGPVACLHLQKDVGVCWAALNRDAPELVPDVHKFPGHIACSSLSNSEIVVPVYNAQGRAVAVLDIDSREYNNFDETDAHMLSKLSELIYQLHTS